MLTKGHSGSILIRSYVEDFPGLVHFMFVDRITNQLTAPSINISADDVDQVAAYVKQQVRFSEFSQEHGDAEKLLQTTPQKR